MNRICGAAAAAAGLMYMRWRAEATKAMEHSVSVPGAGRECQLLFISDLHSRKLQETDLQSFPEKVDAVIIGGDLAELGTPVSVIDHNLALLNRFGPLFAVRGNHDFRRLPLVESLYKKYKATLLINEWVQLDNGLILAGSDDELAGCPDHILSVPRESSGPFVWICHNPRTPETVHVNRRPDLILSGHTHGGQIRLGSFGLDEAGGIKERFNSTLLISNGYGTRKIPFRLGAAPHVHLLNMINHR
ncbi:metallophosphoesterase [Alkalicoccus luteus]|uniref:metallophosphoesterase n=1 Tax=Alkalicoccus luteus TaxID=1237094 RepID=UPI004034D746